MSKKIHSSIVYSFYDAKNNKRQIYLSFKKNESFEIEGDLKSAAFSPDGSQAVYFVNKPNGGELLISKGVNIIKRALKTRLDAAIVNWPVNFISLLSYDKDGYGDLFILKDGGELNKILSSQRDLNVKWSPSGEKIVFSVKDTNGSENLFYKDVKSNGAIIALNVSTTASKCVWAYEDDIICGVKNQAQLKDEFYKINLADKSKTLVATPSTNLLTKELALSRLGDTLFILNDLDSILYALKIKEPQ